jgi:1-pyrroline-5-carboxylate dehydrogenase
MLKGFFQVPKPVNEPVLSYAPGSPERAEVQAKLAELQSKQVDAPLFIGGEEIMTEEKKPLNPPHNHQHLLGHHAWAQPAHVKQAIATALEAKETWEAMSWEQRASIFLKAADLMAGPYRAEMNAATMLAQSKSIHQAEIDAVCELVDFLRFNVHFLSQIYANQPSSAPGMWNRVEYRPLEGFVFCITPFNFTAIAGNLPTAPAMLGNVCIWKPADSQIYSAQLTMRIFREAGMPDGVINLIYGDGPMIGEEVFSHPDFAGLHFTGSTTTFKQLWKTIGANIDRYKSYPRIVGETGGKDYILVHPSSRGMTQEIATAIVRGSFEFQGQKCSAASRVYLPSSLYNDVMERVKKTMETVKMGDPADFGNFVNAVIDRRAFDKITGYIEQVKASDEAEIVVGGGYDDSQGYFVEPTVVITTNPHSLTMEEEVFGPVVTVYQYEDEAWTETLQTLDQTSPYALTGAVFAGDRYAIEAATWALRHTAGNFYINDKPTGSVVGQQPFGGARGSGTNDKAGFLLNLERWASVRTIKETFVPARDYRYPWNQS